MRLELSNRTALARQVLITLATRNGVDPMKGPELARIIGTTRTYLPQVMAPIVSQGWVLSEPGPNGGYRLGPRSRGISMCDLIEAVEGPIIDGRCVLKGSRCSDHSPCAIHDTWARTRAAMIAELKATPAIAPEVRTPDRPREGTNG